MENILKALKQGLISHAYILLGSEEKTGKEAKNIARFVNCQHRDKAPCGFCDNCRKIFNGTHPDVAEIFPEGASIKINQIRGLIASFAEKPLEASNKVYIIHEAQKMTPDAQNALLKTLEDPIGKSIAVLLSDNLKQLLPTVVSRCQVMDFSASDALFCLSPETKQKLVQVILMPPESRKNDIGVMVKGILELEEKPEDIMEFLESLYRDILIVKTKSRAALVNRDLSDMIRSFAQNFSLEKSIRSLQKVLKLTRALKAKGNQNLIWYDLLIELQEVM